MPPSRQVMIVTGEASGDMHGANLIRSLAELDGSLHFFGMGGPELKKAGAEILCDAAKLAVVGLTEVFSHLGAILAARRTLTRAMRERRPLLLILIDFPDFNLMIADQARKLGIPVFYYISQQVWAWRSGRVKKIGRLTDRIGVILPFEKDFYQARGVTVDFVGHPLLDAITAIPAKDGCRKKLGIEPDATVIGLLPGSRRKEITSLLPDFLAAARLLTKATDRKYVFLVPRASTVSRQLLDESGISDYHSLLDIRVSDENRYDIMAACDAVVAASGTVTLELAILGVPTLTTYRLSARTYPLARLLVRLPWFSLVNLIAGREVIPELLQKEVTPNQISAELARIIEIEEVRTEMIRGLAEVRKKLGRPGASRRAAEIALDLIRNNEQ